MADWDVELFTDSGLDRLSIIEEVGINWESDWEPKIWAESGLELLRIPTKAETFWICDGTGWHCHWHDHESEKPLFAKQTVSFLDLPGELRESIYGFAIDDARTTSQYCPAFRDYLPLFATNKKIYAESFAFFFRRTKLNIAFGFEARDDDFGNTTQIIGELILNREPNIPRDDWFDWPLLLYNDNDEDHFDPEEVLASGYLDHVPKVRFTMVDRHHNDRGYNFVDMHFPASDRSHTPGAKPTIEIRRNDGYWASVERQDWFCRKRGIEQPMTSYEDEGLPIQPTPDLCPEVCDPYFANMKAKVEAEFESWLEYEGPDMRFSYALYQDLMWHISGYHNKTSQFQRQQDWWQDFLLLEVY